MRQLIRDRFGLGWRPELAAGILAHLDRIDVVEVIAEDHFKAGRAGLRALRTLAAQVPVLLHGVSLGLASSVPVAEARLERMARLMEATRAEAWSEHLAFVRGGGIEIGHLAAPPRSEAGAAGAAANLRRARRIVGAAPMLENIATLIAPPASTLDEAAWTEAILEEGDGALLLDLHNLYANAVNFGEEPLALLRRFPLSRVAAVHLSGGVWIEGPGKARRLLDDHLHDVPGDVLALLRALGRAAPQPLTVIIERDGRYPPMARLLDQLDAARRARRGPGEHGRMSSARLEAFLARLYTDEAALADFLAAPAASAGAAGLDAEEIAALSAIDRDGLVMAARSFRAKRQGRSKRRRYGRWSGLLAAPIAKIVGKSKRLFMEQS
jgi:uncharacterized protein